MAVARPGEKADEFSAFIIRSEKSDVDILHGRSSALFFCLRSIIPYFLYKGKRSLPLVSRIFPVFACLLGRRLQKRK